MRQIRVMVAFQHAAQATADLQNWLTHTRLGGEAPGIDWLLLLLGAMLLTALIGYGAYSAILRNQVAQNRHPGNLRTLIAALVFLAWIISFTVIFSQAFGGIVLAILLAAWLIYLLTSLITRRANRNVAFDPPLAGAALIFLIIAAAAAYSHLNPGTSAQLTPRDLPSPQPTSPEQSTVTTHDQAMQAYADGNRAFNQEDFETAIGHYTRAIDLDPPFTEAYVARGNARVALMQYDRAVADYDQALQVDPMYASAYFSRGTVRWLLGELRAGENDYRKSIQIEPGNHFYYARLGAVLKEEHKSGEMGLLYKEAFQQDSSREWALTGWLGVLSLKEHYKALLSKCSELWDENIRSTPVLFYRGLANLRLHHYDEAVDDLRHVTQADPEGLGFEAYSLLAESYRGARRVEDCQSALLEFETRNGHERDFDKDWCNQGGSK